MKAGDAYRGNRAMRHVYRYEIVSINGDVVKVRTANGESFVARNMVQNNIDLGLLVKAN